MIKFVILFFAAILFYSCEEGDLHPNNPLPDTVLKWRLQDSTHTMIMVDIHCVDQYKAYVVGSRRGSMYANSLFYTVEAGDPWRYRSYPPEFNHSDMKSVYFQDRNTGWVAGTYGIILHTTDQGISWTQQQTNTDKHIRDITFRNTIVGHAVGDDTNILHTTDAGSSWMNLGLNKHNGDFNAVEFNYAKVLMIGWSWKNNPVFLLANDGFNYTGYTIQTGYTPQVKINALEVMDHTAIWISGELGLIAKTTDEGHSWSRYYVEDRPDINDIMFIDKQKGWAVGDDGTIVRTTDGGSSWIKENLNTDDDFNALYMVNDTVGWAITNKYVYRYSKEIE